MSEAPASGPGRRRWPRRLARGVAWLFGGLALLVALALLGARLYLTEARTIGLVEGLLDDALAGDFEIGGLDWAPFPVGVVLTDVEVRDPDGAPVLEAARLQARVALLPLLSSRVEVPLVDLRGVDVRLVDEGQGYGLVRALKPAAPQPEEPSEPGGLALELSRIDVRDLDLTLAQEGLEVAVEGFYLAGGSVALADGELRAEAQSVGAGRVRVRPGERAVDLQNLELTGLAYDGAAGEASVDHADARVGDSHLSISGGVEGLAEDRVLTVDARGHALLTLSDPLLLGLLPPDLTTALDPDGELQLAFEAEGPVSAPTVQVRATADRLTISGVPIRDLGLSARSGHETVRLSRLEARVGEGSLSASGEVALGAPGRWEGEVETETLPLRRLAGAFVDPGLLPRQVSGRLSAEGLGLTDPRGQVAWDLRIRGRPEALPAALPEDLRATGRATLAGDAIGVESLHVQGGGADLRLTGRLPLGPGAMDLHLALRHERPSEGLAAMDLPVRAGALSLTADVGGTLEAPEADGRLEVTGLAAAEGPPTDVVVPFGFRGGALRLDRATAQAAGGRLVVDGAVQVQGPGGAPLDAPRLDLTLDGQGFDLSPFTGGYVQGAVAAGGRVRGTPSRLFGRLAVRMDSGRLGDADLAEVVATVAFEGREADLQAFAARFVPGGTLSGSARLDLTDLRVAARVQGQGLPMAVLAGLAQSELPADGRLTFQARAGGTVSSPDWAVDATVSGLSSLERPLGTLELSALGTLEYAEAEGRLVGPAGELTFQGGLEVPTGLVEARVDVAGLRLGLLPGLAPEDAEGAPLADGTLVATASVDGFLPLPDLFAEVKVADLALEGRAFGGGPVVLTVEPSADGSGLDAAVLLADAGQARAHIARGPPLAVTASAHLAALDVGRLVPQLADYDTQATLTGDLAAAWRQGAPEATRARVELTEVRLALPGEATLHAARPVVARYEDGVAVLEDLTLEGPEGRFHAEGRVGETLDLLARGRLQVGLVAPFAPAIARASGALELDLALKGPPDAPVAEGELRLATPVTLRPRTMVREIALERGRVVFTPGEVRIDRLQGRMDEGAFLADGRVGLDGLTPETFRLELKAQNLPLRTQDVLLELNTDLEVSGSLNRVLVAGAVDVVSGRYFQKFELQDFNFVAQRKEVEEPLERQVPFVRNVFLDLRATSSGGMDVGIDAGAFAMNLNLQTDLQVTGTVARPVLDGRVTAERGAIVFPAAELDVTQGTVDFVPALGGGLNPAVELTAEGEVTPAAAGLNAASITYFVTLTFDGRLDELVMDLTSDPALDRLEVLSLLVSGRVNPFEGTGRSTAKTDAALAFAGTQLAAPLTRFVSKGLEEVLNLELQLGTEVTTEAITVTAAKDVSRRLRLEGAYQQGLGEQQQSIGTVRARFLLSDQLFLEGAYESVSGTTTALSAAREGQRSQLELRLRIFGDS